ncbi:MAG TPA: hypothetical protein VD913_00165, partial [bacterium]|nr:hypothetical protein [bacterium]
YPYYGLKWNGKNSGVLELPFVTQDTWGKADLGFLKQLITESDENFHQCLVINFHPHYRILEEEGRDMWLGAIRFAKEKNQWTPTLEEFFNFTLIRTQAHLTSRWDLPVLSVETNSPAEMILSLPLIAFPGQKIISMELDGHKMTGRKVSNMGFEELLLEIPKGAHKVRSVYGS